jgi:hypothetical protein
VKNNNIKEAMKNLKPRRELSTDFTPNTLQMATANKHPGYRFLLGVPALHKAGAAAVVIVAVLLTGGVYAATHWPEITAKFGSDNALPTGNHVIGVDTTNCNYFQVRPDTAVSSKQKIYYEIKKDSSLSTKQIVDMVQGICESNLANAYVNEVVEKYTDKKVISGGVYDIAEISPDSITVKYNKQYLVGNVINDNTITYKKFATDMRVFDGNRQVNISDLKVGDSVQLVARDEHALPTEADRDNPNHWTDPDLITILNIVRVPSPTASPMTFFLHLGKDFVRTEPCKDGPGGFCRAYQFDD